MQNRLKNKHAIGQVIGFEAEPATLLLRRYLPFSLRGGGFRPRQLAVMNKIIFSIIFSTFLIALTVSDIFACSCFPQEEIPIERQVRDAYQKSSAVFVGKVIKVNEKSDVVLVRFRVEKIWNNKFQGEITVSTAKDSAACGYKFEIGKKYLVYSDGKNNNLTTNICTRTSTSESNKDIAFLNKIKKPKIKYSPK